jgi:hypothetical protein
MLDAGGIDLVYFSTTVFTAMTLGRIWKTRFGVPFVVDMQDAWITDYYRDKPRAQRPPKFWFADRLHRILEPWTMNQVDGLVAVSSAYIDVLQQRYPRLKDVPVRTLPFGAEPRDFEVIREDRQTNRLFAADDGLLHGVYVGRGGADMAPAVHALFRAFRRGLDERPGLFRHVRLHFGGTSYACDGRATKTIEPLAARYDLERYVSESPARLPYFEALQALTDSDFLIVPGSDDPQYTASKIYPYILARKPLIAIFRESSSVCDVLNRTNAGTLVPLTGVERTDYERAYAAFTDVVSRLPFVPSTDWEQFRPYHAAEMTRQQCEIFDDVLRRRAAVAAVVSPGDAAVASAGGAP